ncbi:MAG: hypothetical protein OEM81_00575 [Acidimicrobiia bacterium]|nr:hypothetical protein [Acidimicrobiia bacterium]MDH3396304.1 hypothetical protein [Acidimicrobiia bacterium]
MMHEHDFELIAAIAEGGLSPDEQAVAEASLASCEACSTDLQLQREALEALRGAAPVVMTDLERAGLHRSVAAQFAPAVVKPKPAVPWFQRLMPAMAAAAALLVVVGVGSVLIDGGGSADSAAETTPVAGESLRTAAEEALPEVSGGAEFDASTGAPTSTMAALAPTASGIREYGSISVADLAEIAGRLDAFEEEDGANTYSANDLESLQLDSVMVCAEIALDEGQITVIGRAIVDGDGVEIYRINDLVKVYLISDCSLMDPFE